MTLKKAIDNRTAYLKNSELPKSTDDYNATLLSIEALKRLAIYRNRHPELIWELLPGETKE